MTYTCGTVYVMYRHTESRTLELSGLTHRSGPVSRSAQAGYTALMRYLGLALFAAMAAMVVVANGQPAPAQTQADVVPAPTPHWSAVYAEAFPGCVGTGSFVPARIVVVAREGAAKVVRYNDATVARINATWATPDAWDDLYTIGRCKR